MEGGVSLIVIGALLQIIQLHLSRRNVAVIHAQLAIFLFVEDVVVVKHCLYLHTSRIGKHLVAIQAIFVNGDIAVQSQLEDVSKQIHLLVDRLYRIIKACIIVAIKVNLAIDVATPHHILRHIDSRWEHQTGSHAHALTLRLSLLLLLCFLLLLATSLGLSLRFANE